MIVINCSFLQGRQIILLEQLLTKFYSLGRAALFCIKKRCLANLITWQLPVEKNGKAYC